MDEIGRKARRDLVANFLNLVEQQQRFPPNHMMAMFGMYALVNILNLVQPENPLAMEGQEAAEAMPPKQNKEALMETLNGLLKSQGTNASELLGMLGSKGGGPANGVDLLGALGKNPATVMNFMNLLASAKEAINVEPAEEKLLKKAEEGKTIPFKERNT